ncbi:MAG: SNF2-related protein, partial [Desulfobacteraceae bacterium]|nr:SNF2-related protein [Desulfobacteraceae bacterium]
MTNKAKTRGPKKRKQAGPKKIEKIQVTEKDLARVEFHRHSYALIPKPEDRRPGVAFWIKGGEHDPDWRFCSCSLSESRVCSHILELSGFYKFILKRFKDKGPYDDFRSSLWYHLGVILEEKRTPCQAVRIHYIDHDNEVNQAGGVTTPDNFHRIIRIVDKDGDALLSYFSSGPDLSRLIERLSKIDDEDSAPNRASILERLSLLTLSENERMMLDSGFKTRGLALIESFWYRMTYHCYREFGLEECTFHPAIEEKSGAFTITCRRAEGDPVFRTQIPRHLVRRLITALKKYLPNQNNMAIHPIPLKSIFKITMNTEMDLDILPMVQLLQEDGEEHFLKRENLERFTYGDLVFIKELGLMTELEKPGRDRKFQAPVRMTLKKSQVPVFLEEYGEELFNESYLLDEKVKSIKILKSIDKVTISPEAIDRDWCWLDVKYGFGSTHVSLKEILSARENGERFIGTGEGWIDCHSPEIESVSGAFPEMPSDNENGLVKLSRLDLLRLKATSTKPIETDGDSKEARRLNDILELKTSISLPPLKGMRSTLRQYQKTGVEWLLYLFENGFGGLLCDDMGLGKTHQSMALMLYLKKIKKQEGPILVVCPTTVMSHWQKKIKEHVPDLITLEYHGGQRDLKKLVRDSDVILTSYG